MSFRMSAAPLTSEIESLHTITAELWVKIKDDSSYFLDGAAFDRKGVFYCTNPKSGDAYTVTADGKVTQIYSDAKLRPIAVAFTNDNQMFWTAETASGIGTFCRSDSTFKNITEITPRYEGRPTFFNDLDINSDGVIYVTDSTGQHDNPTGGVYAFSPDLKTITPIVRNLIGANGIALGPLSSAIRPKFPFTTKTKSGYVVEAGTRIDMLWIGEAGTGNVINLQFVYTPDGPVYSPIAGYNEPYHVNGLYPTDGMECDQAGNVYISVSGQGMILILSKTGIPIAKVLIPDRDRANGIMSTNMTIKPGTDEGYLVTGGGTGPAAVYRFQALAKSQI